MPYLGNVPAEAYSQMSYQDLTGGSGTSFTLDYPVGNENEIEVFVNNVRQEPTVAYTTAGTALTMTGTIAATDDFYVVFQGKAQQTIGIPEKQTNGDYNFSSNTLYVDASTSRVGVGNAAPTTALDVTGTVTADGLTVDTTGIVYSSGNVGIGTASPSYQMEFASSSGAGTQFGITYVPNSVTLLLRAGGGDANIGTVGSHPLLLKTGNTERMRILTTGELCLNDTARTLACVQHLSFDGANEQGLCIKNTVNNQGGAAVRFIDYTGAQSGGGIYFTSSNSITYATSSDARLKENVADMTGAIDRVKALAPKRFNFIADPDSTTVDGFLAHEAQAVVPEAVIGTNNGVDDDGNPIYQAMDASRLVPLLTGALKEAITKIEALETSNADLTARIEALETAS